MSRYHSKSALIGVITYTIKAAGINPREVYMSRVIADLKLMGDRHYGWTMKDPGLDPVEVAKRHMREKA